MSVIKRVIDIVYDILHEEFSHFRQMGLDQQALTAMSITSQVMANNNQNIEKQIKTLFEKVEG